jgi:hypothetical protein
MLPVDNVEIGAQVPALPDRSGEARSRVRASRLGPVLNGFTSECLLLWNDRIGKTVGAMRLHLA